MGQTLSAMRLIGVYSSNKKDRKIGEDRKKDRR